MWRLATSTNQATGFILVAIVAITASLLFLAGYFLEQSTSEIKISKNENVAMQTYYLAEAGANEAIYKLKNDATWRAKFLGGTLTNETLSRNQVFDAGSSYTIVANSVSAALANITVTAKHTLGSQQTQRIIKTRLARANNSASSWGQSVFGGGTGGQQNGNITFERNCTVTGGAIHANQNFKVTSSSTLTVNNAAVAASNNIIVNSGSSLVLNNSTQAEGASSIGMPQIDFDSSSSTSLKNRANQTYTASQFSNLPSGTVLNGITFVTGAATWKSKNLTINGILAASDDIDIDLIGNYAVTINANAATGSGLLAKDDLEIFLDGNGASLNISGLLYASKKVEIDTKKTVTFSITGGLIGWHVAIEGADAGTCSVTYDSTLAYQPLDPVLNGSESPIIEVNHWEEQY